MFTYVTNHMPMQYCQYRANNLSTQENHIDCHELRKPTRNNRTNQFSFAGAPNPIEHHLTP